MDHQTRKLSGGSKKISSLWIVRVAKELDLVWGCSPINNSQSLNCRTSQSWSSKSLSLLFNLNFTKAGFQKLYLLVVAFSLVKNVLAAIVPTFYWYILPLAQSIIVSWYDTCHYLCIELVQPTMPTGKTYAMLHNWYNHRTFSIMSSVSWIAFC